LYQLLSKVTDSHILEFLHHMFNVSALLLDDALLKCVVTEALFAIIGYIDISQSIVATHLRCDGFFSDSIITDVLLILTSKKN